MWSFPGAYANRGSGTEQASSDVGPSDRIRTCGIVVPNHARYQLRYTRMLREYELSRKSVAIIQHPPRGSKRKIPRGAERQSA